MRGQRTHLIDALIGAAHSDGGWCKIGATRSLTVTAEVTIALCDYYAQAPSVPSLTESKLLKKIDTALIAAEPFVLDSIKTRILNDKLDPPNCTLALAAYLTLRSHRTEKGQALGPVDIDFVTNCIDQAIKTLSWLNGKPGAIWACAKAFEIISEYLREDIDTHVRDALLSSRISILKSELQIHIVQFFASNFVELGELYSTSVCLDLSFSVSGWASTLNGAALEAARQKSLGALRLRFPDISSSNSLTLNDFHTSSGEDNSYQVVAPAALLTGIDHVLRTPSLPSSRSPSRPSCPHLRS